MRSTIFCAASCSGPASYPTRPFRGDNKSRQIRINLPSFLDFSPFPWRNSVYSGFLCLQVLYTGFTRLRSGSAVYRVDHARLGAESIISMSAVGCEVNLTEGPTFASLLACLIRFLRCQGAFSIVWYIHHSVSMSSQDVHRGLYPRHQGLKALTWESDCIDRLYRWHLKEAA